MSVRDTVERLEAIQRWSATCRVRPWTLAYQEFLSCISSQGQDLYSHQKLNMYIVHLLVLIWERLQTPTTTTPTPTTPDATVQPLGRHIANNSEDFSVYAADVTTVRTETDSFWRSWDETNFL